VPNELKLKSGNKKVQNKQTNMRKDYNKLVRDRIPQIITASSPQATFGLENYTTTAEFKEALLAKLVEEAEEAQSAATSREELLTELADLYEVVNALLETFELDKEELLTVQASRRAQRGGFEQRLKLLWVDHSNSSQTS
jgi:predicted house-cleaning noncanonical NTP pyrophosphatase (MazG superfamily)